MTNLSGDQDAGNEALAATKSRLRARGLFAIVAIIAAASFAAIVPMFWLGVPSGHDFEFHMNSWMEAASQWQQGILYPRWAAMAHYAYGEPRFIFYPPASWMLGAGLGTALPWMMVPGAYIWVVLTASGCSMFALARNWLPRQHAVFAAVLYAVNPYHLVIIYWRSAFAELMAGVWLPLLLLFVLRLEREGRRAMVYLALVVAAVWLTNAPAAVMANYSLVLLVAVVALVRRSPRVLLYGAGACALGIALAGFYVLPAAYEQRWVNIYQVLAPGVRPHENFLFAVINDPDHNRFNRLVSIMAVLEIAVLGTAVLLSRKHRREHPELWWSLAAWGGTAAALMFPFTLFLWKYLPQLRFIQIPWRWLLCLNVAFVLLVTMGIRRWLARFLVYAAMLVALAAVWHRVQPPWWDRTADIEAMTGDIEDGRGYESVYEYVPAGGNVDVIERDAPEVAVEGDKGQVQMDDWAPESKSFSVAVTRPSRLLLRLFHYPAWNIEVNGHAVRAEAEEDTGQLIIPVQAGKSNVRIIFSRTWDRTLGGVISGVALLLGFLLFAVRSRRGERRAQETSSLLVP